MTTYTVSSGVTSDGLVLNPGDTEYVLSGGTAIDTTTTSAAAIDAGGTVIVSSGGLTSGTTVSYGGNEYVDGGTASGTTVYGGASEWVSAGGTTVGTVVNAGGEYVSSGGLSISTTENSGVWFDIYSGGTASAATVNSATMNVSGGTAIGTTVSSGGTQVVSSGGVASGTTINSGSFLVISSAGSATDAIVEAGGTATVSSGGVLSGGTISAGNLDVIGTTVSNTTVSGTGLIVDGGTAVGVTAIGATPYTETAATEIYVTSGGVISGSVLESGRQWVVGATAIGTIISSGGEDQIEGGGTSINDVVSSGGLEALLAGGVGSNTTIDAGGLAFVFSASIASGTTVNSGGFLFISSGGSATDATVESGGTATVSSGGVLSGATVSDGTLNVSGTTVTGAGLVVDGGTAIGVTAIGAVPAGDTGDSVIYVESGGVVSGSVLENARELVVGATAIGTIISAGGEDDIQGGGTTINDVVSSGGLEALLAGGVASSTTIDAGGFTYVFSASTATGTTINSGGVLDILSGGSATDTTLTVGGTIDVSYVPYAAGATATLDSSTDVLTVTDGSNTLTYQMAGSYTNDTFVVSSDTNGDTQITLTPCFRAGTRILTDRGEILVERLAIGDRVMTAAGMPLPIKWVGHRSLDLTRHPDPDLVRPVVIAAGAMGEGAPHRDLHVSPDHALLLDGMLVPARLLVNGGSIRSERACRAVVYYHVELDAHDILLAENLPAESYLDTGNRAMFEDTGMPMLLHPDFGNDQNRRAMQSCRPFADDPAVVEPIWRRLASRSTQLDMPLPAAVETTRNPDLRVVIDGRTLKPVSVQGDRYVFVLPAARSAIHLVSRAAKPCDRRPWVEDHRRLGVMISRLTVTRGTEMEEIPLDHPHLSNGWWAIETDQASVWRWTNGDAVVPVSGDGSAVLEVTLRETLDYPVDGQAIAATVVPAEAA